MSKIGEIYPKIIAKIDELFPYKTRLHNPYSIEENPDVVKKDSWGLRVGDASPEEIEFCNLSINRQFTFVLVKQMVSLAGKEDGFDDLSIKLLDEQQTFLNAFYSPDEIGAQELIDRLDFSSITGVQQLVTNAKRYLFCEITFNILTSESI